MSTEKKGIFAGLKVLDCASFIAGPAAATILSDFGADVIKIEPPGAGDPHRYLYLVDPNPRSKSNYFWQLTNRNKRSLAINLKDPKAIEILKKLVMEADVFVVNFPPRVREALGLTYENAAKLNKRIIYADISGYGEAGSEANKPGFDVTAYWARTGLMDSTRNAGSPPPVCVSGIGDHATASTLYGAIVTALYRREKTGEGGKVSTSLIAEGAWAAAGWIQAALDGTEVQSASVDRTKPSNALGNTYETLDNRWLILAMVAEAKDWPGLAAAIGRPDLLEDDRFKEIKSRRQNAEALFVELQKTFSTQPLVYWREELDRMNVTFGVVQTINEIAKDQQLIINNIIRPIANSGPDTSTHTIDSPIKIHGENKTEPRLAPTLGQHTSEILKELGLSDNDIEQLKSVGTVA